MADIFNITIDQGSTFIFKINVVDRNALPVNLSAYLLRGQIRKKRLSSTISKEFRAQVVDPALGRVQLSLTATETASLASGESRTDAGSKYFYDAEIFKGDGTVIRIIEGQVTVAPEVTRPVPVPVP